MRFFGRLRHPALHAHVLSSILSSYFQPLISVQLLHAFHPAPPSDLASLTLIWQLTTAPPFTSSAALTHHRSTVHPAIHCSSTSHLFHRNSSPLQRSSSPTRDDSSSPTHLFCICACAMALQNTTLVFTKGSREFELDVTRTYTTAQIARMFQVQ